jgi:hypothetical protein
LTLFCFIHKKYALLNELIRKHIWKYIFPFTKLVYKQMDVSFSFIFILNVLIYT